MEYVAEGDEKEMKWESAKPLGSSIKPRGDKISRSLRNAAVRFGLGMDSFLMKYIVHSYYIYVPPSSENNALVQNEDGIKQKHLFNSLLC